MSAIRKLFHCCFPQKISDAVIQSSEEKVIDSPTQNTTLISKIEEKMLSCNIKVSNANSNNKTKAHSSNGSNITPPCKSGQSEPLPSNRIISPEDISNASLITLKDMTSNKSLFGVNNINKELTINAAGLLSQGLRNENDGVVFFGINTHQSHKEHISTTHSPFKVDIELNDIDNAKTNLTTPLPFLFVIYYLKEGNKYKIKFCTDGNEAIVSKDYFIRLAPKMELAIRHIEILSFGKILLMITPCNDYMLEISIVNNPMSKRVFKREDERITIGRGKTCDIPFNRNKSFSKIQSTIRFDKGLKCWVLKDGSEEKNSTNGTWIFAINSYTVANEMIIEVCHCQIKVLMT